MNNSNGAESAYVDPQDKRELQKVLATYRSYKSLPHLLWSYLARSLIPRIHKGKCFPRRLLTEVAGRKTTSEGREKIQLGRADWEQVEEAASALAGHVRRLEERVAWSGSLRSFPFCCCGPELIVRAGAREIAVWSRGGLSELFSQERPSGWPGPGEGESGGDPGKTGGSGPTGGAARGPGRADGDDDQPTGRKAGKYQVMKKLPGRDRGGKAVQFAITEDAKKRLKRKAGRLSQDGSDLLRRGTLQIIEWVGQAPKEAFRYIREESDLYQRCREGEGYGFQVYVAAGTKRRIEKALGRLEEGPAKSADRGVAQREILQAAARLAIESPDEDMLPPLPGAGNDR